MAASPVTKSLKPQPYYACLMPQHLNDDKYCQFCLASCCIYPGWCILQQKVLNRMRIHIKPQSGLDPNNTPLPKSTCSDCCCHPLFLGLAFCCVGLAINRAHIRTAIDKTAEPHFPLDVCLFVFCGYCVMTRDLAVAFPGEDRSGTNYESTKCSCINPKYFCHVSNCLACCCLALLPFPCYCCIQAYVTSQANSDNSFWGAFLRPICCCCFGFALNRDKINKARGHQRYFCFDCLRYACPLVCCCSIMQEYLEGRNKVFEVLNAQ